jgi:hypothetical protein
MLHILTYGYKRNEPYYVSSNLQLDTRNYHNLFSAIAMSFYFAIDRN